METRIVFHIDFDYFYAQCEEVRRPELKSKPVCVCVYSDRGGDSGAVATANYVAREYGAKSGMPISLAKKRLADRQDAVFLPVDFAHYQKVSDGAMETISQSADVFEYVGRDEAYLDVTRRTGGDFGRAAHLAQQIKNAVRGRTELSCSIGVSPNRAVSKIASDYQKPDGLTVVTPDRVTEFLGPLEIRKVPGIGKKSEARFSEMGLRTVADLRGLDVFALNREFGRKNGTYIYNMARGIDDDPVREREARVQYSRITTLKADSTEYGFLSQNLARLCADVHGTVTKNNAAFKSVGIHFVQSDLTSKTRTRMLRSPTTSLEELRRSSDQLLREALRDQRIPVRRLGVRVSELSEARGQSSITSYF